MSLSTGGLKTGGLHTGSLGQVKIQGSGTLDGDSEFRGLDNLHRINPNAHHSWESAKSGQARAGSSGLGSILAAFMSWIQNQMGGGQEAPADKSSEVKPQSIAQTNTSRNAPEVQKNAPNKNDGQIVFNVPAGEHATKVAQAMQAQMPDGASSPQSKAAWRDLASNIEAINKDGPTQDRINIITGIFKENPEFTKAYQDISAKTDPNHVRAIAFANGDFVKVTFGGHSTSPENPNQAIPKAIATGVAAART